MSKETNITKLDTNSNESSCVESENEEVAVESYSSVEKEIICEGKENINKNIHNCFDHQRSETLKWIKANIDCKDEEVYKENFSLCWILAGNHPSGCG